MVIIRNSFVTRHAPLVQPRLGIKMRRRKARPRPGDNPAANACPAILAGYLLQAGGQEGASPDDAYSDLAIISFMISLVPP